MINIKTLLANCSDVKIATIGDICEIKTGRKNANAMVEDGEYPFFTCDAKPFKIDTYSFDGEAILISGNGSQVGHLNYYVGKFDAYQRTYVLMKFDKNINAKFLLYILKNSLKNYILDNCKSGSIPYITLPMLQNFSIPLPPLTTQLKIVEVLDKFTSLEKELEKELEMRKKQYQYYRDKLLTFTEEERGSERCDDWRCVCNK